MKANIVSTQLALVLILHCCEAVECRAGKVCALLGDHCEGDPPPSHHHHRAGDAVRCDRPHAGEAWASLRVMPDSHCEGDPPPSHHHRCEVDALRCDRPPAGEAWACLRVLPDPHCEVDALPSHHCVGDALCRDRPQRHCCEAGVLPGHHREGDALYHGRDRPQRHHHREDGLVPHPVRPPAGEAWVCSRGLHANRCEVDALPLDCEGDALCQDREGDALCQDREGDALCQDRHHRAVPVCDPGGYPGDL